MRYVLYFLLLTAVLNAQTGINPDFSPPNSHFNYNKDIDAGNSKLSPAAILEQFKKAREDTVYLYAPLITYSHTIIDTGIAVRKDSTRYNSEGRLLFRLQQYDDHGVWINSLKDTSYIESSGGGEIYHYELTRWEDSAWVNDYHIMIEYDQDGSVLNYTQEDFNEHTTPIYKVEYNYNEGLLSQTTTYRGTSDSLMPRDRNTFMHNPAGKETEHIIERWMNGIWSNISRTASVYDQNDFMTQSSFYLWGTSDWRLLSVTDYENDSSGVLVVSVTKANQDSTLVNLSKVEYFYSEFGNIANQMTYTWSDEDWRNSTKEDYEYNAMQLSTSYTRYIWNPIDSTWLMQYKISYTYDEGGFLLTILEEHDTFKQQIEYTNDENGNRAKGTCVIWKDPNWFSENGTLDNKFETYFAYRIETEYEYLDPVSVEEDNPAPVRFVLNQNYPNPFNPGTQISFSLPQSGKTMLKVYDILGREVAELVNGQMEKGPHSVSFNGRNLSSGVYIYRLQSGSFTESKKMMLIK